MSMKKGWLFGIVLLAVIVALAPSVMAQESAAKGSLTGNVVDSTGGAIVGAQTTLSGATGSQSQTTSGSGTFNYLDLIPGTYKLAVEMKGFRRAEVPDITIFVGRGTSVRVQLEPGSVTSTVEVVSSAVTVDTTSTALATNLNDDFYQKLPVQRGVASLFYIAPGAVDGGGTGRANPSISGGSGLENLYVADGVSITDTAFGGLGLYSRNYGSVGTGINLSFIKEVQVKTGGFQPQYGGATGGVVQIVTKSGSHDYHGALSAFYQPHQFEANRLNPDSFGLVNPVGDVVHNAGLDASVEFGGSVPGFRNNLFFFGSADPTLNSTFQKSEFLQGNAAFGQLQGRTWVYNYAGKLTWKVNDRHSLEGSVFGDPSYSNRFPWSRLQEGVGPNSSPTGLAIPNTTNFSKLEYGNRDVVTRYNGTLSPTWVVNASLTWQHNKFTESGYDNSVQRIRDETQTAIGPIGGQQGLFNPVGFGFVENTRDESYSGNINTTKIFNFWGQHSFDVGYAYTRSYYDGQRSDSGPVLAPPIENAAGHCLTGSTDPITGAPTPCDPLTGNVPIWAGSPANYVWRLLPRANMNAAGNFTCTQCALMNVPGAGVEPVYLRMFRSEFGLGANGFKNFGTHSRFHVGYVNDSWTINKYVTIDAGVRWQQERLVGENSNYTFTGDWSPRIGVSVDPIGDRKNKIYFNFGRYSYNLPLDLAERSLTNELDLFAFRLVPDFSPCAAFKGVSRCVNLNAFGTVTPVIDSAHVVNGVPGGPTQALPFASTESGEAIHTGTHSTYEDEYVFGAEHQFSHGIVASARFIHRSLRRIVEDSGGPSPEAALAGVVQQFSIANISKNLDIFTNAKPHPYFSSGATPAACGGDHFDSGPLENSFGNPIFDAQGHDAVCFEEVSSPNPGAVFDNGAYVGNAAIGIGGCQLTPFDPISGTGGEPVPGHCNVAGQVTPDGIPDGFTDPIRKYWAVEFEVNKTFSHNWQLRANYRIAKLFGNFEGAFRNDNGQSDPGISSLFDFTTGQFNQLGNQFLPGVLNTDRQQVANGYFSYVFDHGKLKNLTLGTGTRVTTGTPINEMAAHPVYQNAGEIPIGGRGSQGRTPTTGSVDFHADYVMSIMERMHLRFGADLFNIANTKRILNINQNIDLGFGTQNQDFLKPNTIVATRGDTIQSPFNARVFARLEF
jgi:hypothetical protein